MIEERFDKAVRLVRNALETQELSIAGELDVREGLSRPAERRPPSSKLLLVDSPLLLFEALALDKAAGVFFPVHVLVSADGDRTRAVCVEPSSLFDVRLPAGSSEPLANLRKRVMAALEAAAAQSRLLRPGPLRL